MGYLFFNSNYERENLLSKHQGKYTLPITGLGFCIKKQHLAQGFSKILAIFPFAASFSFTDVSKFT